MLHRLFALAIIVATTSAHAADRPNIVWITTEDNSPIWLRLYNPERGAPMPNVERLAERGLVFEHAFSNAPVCSVARSTIISGCYAPRVLAQFHRRTELVPLPGDLKMFPHYLREAGYYTTNNSKQDYNFLLTKSAWDKSSNKATYRDRAEGQPFFHVQNYTTTHESRLHFSQQVMETEQTTDNPDDIEVFPYHPDTPTFRYTYARQLDQHRKVDAEIGKFLDRLEADGLMEETIIFYYGDHGGVLPRGKGYAYESGLHVPMIVSFPKKWQHLAPAAMATRVDGFVSFVDLAPTVLHLAGIDVPVEMDGQPFVGDGITLDELNSRQTAFGYADRFDEKYDLVRTWRKGNFKYIRNYQPFNFDGLQNDYRYRMLAYQEWRWLYHEGKLNDAQRQFFEPKPAEALYDLAADPHEVHNLAGDPKYADTLAELRAELQQQVRSMPDLSFYPESVLVEEAISNPVDFGQQRKEEIAALVDIADLSVRPFDEVQHEIAAALKSDDPWKQYWGLIVCSSFGKEAAVRFAGAAYEIVGPSPEPLLRARAVQFLTLIGSANPRNVIYGAVRGASSPTEANLILNMATMLEDGPPGIDFTFQPNSVYALATSKRKSLVKQRIDYLNSPH